jgi:hypothetical protein
MLDSRRDKTRPFESWKFIGQAIKNLSEETKSRRSEIPKKPDCSHARQVIHVSCT